jgi:hypothetical protein
MASYRQFDWTTANLAILNGRVIANRGVRTGRKPSSAVRTDHLDIFFEVHTLKLSLILGRVIVKSAKFGI